jgi:hypothetical protein
MKSKVFGIGTEAVLLLAGGLLLVDRAGAFGPGHFVKGGGMILFGVASAAFFCIYFLHGIRNWGWLLPAMFCASLFLTIGMDQAGVEGPYPAVPLFAGPALPFFAGYAVTKRRWLLVPGVFLGLFAAFLATSTLAGGDWAGVAFFGLLALALLAAYFLLSRPWGLLFLAGGSISIGSTVMLETLIPHEEIPPLPGTYFQIGYYTWALILGLGITFGILWLLRRIHHTAWAIFPATGLISLAAAMWLLGGRYPEGWFAAGLLLTGVTLLLSSGWRSLKLRPRKG